MRQLRLTEQELSDLLRGRKWGPEQVAAMEANWKPAAKPLPPKAPKAKPEPATRQNPRKRAQGSEFEDMLALQCAQMRLPAPERQFRFLPERRYAADFAFRDAKLLVEVDGGSFMKAKNKDGEITGSGGHTRGVGYRKDRERDALAMIAGWRVLRVVPEQVKCGQAVRWIAALVNTTLPAK